MVKEKLLRIRKQIKTKRPFFIRQDAHKKTKIKKKWRRPKGLQSKMRLHKSGHRKGVSSGYRAPKKVRNLHPTGLEAYLINSTKDIKNINPKNQGAIIAKKVGLKKRIELIKMIKERGITILNIKDVDKFIKHAEENIKKRKEKKESKQEEKISKKRGSEKRQKKRKGKGLSKKLSDEERKKEEKKQKDRLLAKKTI